MQNHYLMPAAHARTIEIRSRPKAFVCAVASVAFGGMPIFAAAQQSSEAASEEPQQVVVTAQKRGAELLQDVPIPISVLTAETLVDRNQLRLQDYAATVPGLNVTPATSAYQYISIRGITTFGNNPKVGVLVDDMPFGASTHRGGGNVIPNIDPGDIARIEVLRGPQGTLYGASSLGGLIKYVTVDPSTDGIRGRIQAGLNSVYSGSDVGLSMRGSLNVPLSDTAAFIASGFTRREPGYVDNVTTGRDNVNEQQVSGGRLAGLWRLSDELVLKLSALYQDYKADGSNEVSVLPGLGDLQQRNLRGTGGFHEKVQAYSATLDAKLGSVDLTSLSGYNVFRLYSLADLTSSALANNLNLTNFGVSSSGLYDLKNVERFTQEIRASMPIGQKMDGVIGVYYNHEDSEQLQDWVAIDPATGQEAGRAFLQSLPSAYQEYAAFADLTYHFTERFNVQVGARQSHIDQSLGPVSLAGPYVTTVLLQPSPYNFSKRSMDADPFTFLVTPQFKATQDLMLYARFASGYGSGGINAAASVLGIPFDPEKTQNYEIGVKADLLDRQLSVDASVYYIDYKDIQLAIRDQATSLVYTANGGRAKSQGIELAIRSRPISGLTLAAWGAWDIAELTEDCSACNPSLRAGYRLPLSARFSGNLSADQDFPMGTAMSGFVGSSLTYVGRRNGNISATPQVFPAYATVDARAGVKYDTWTVNLFVNNVADRRGALNGDPFVNSTIFYTQPRTVGLNLTKTF